jgi:prolyl-tRNA synthetase
MLLSKLLGERFKEKPAEASMISHIFLLRGGYVRQVATGIYSLLPPAKRIVAKIEQIIREEMDNIDGQEVLFPVVMPAELWQESGRYESVGSELLRMKDRNGHSLLLGMTHEEASVHMARTEATSYTKFPFMIYQIQTKFRDEPRARGGLIRVREFTMKDAYSFHTTQEDLAEYYQQCHEAYEKIFRRAGFSNIVSVESDTGMMGGSLAHEFMLISEGGEDSLVLCPACQYRANVEVSAVKPSHTERPEGTPSLHHTPGMTTIEDLCEFFKIDKSQTLKAAVFAVEGQEKPIVVFLRGDYDVNEAKLRRVVGANVFPYAGNEEDDLCFGFIGPHGLETSARVFFDASLMGENDLVSGANQKDYHYTGINVTKECLGKSFPEEFYDLAKARQGDPCPACGHTTDLRRGIEMGNIFQLGRKYTESMDMTYVDSDGQRRHPIMGCYGIGVGRMLAGAIEEHHDDYGPIWPISIAPWQIHICSLGAGKSPEVGEAARSIYDKLSARYEVLLDDRDVTAGVAFADADLLGVPLRVIVGKRGLDKGEIELVRRDKSVRVMVPLENLEAEIDAQMKALWEELGS